MVIMQIKNHTNIVQQMYSKQRNEKIKNELIQKKTCLIRNLCSIKNPALIKQFAITELNMKKVALHQIKTVTNT